MGEPMTRQDILKISMTRVAAVAGLLLSLWLLVTAAKTSMEAWFLPRPEYREAFIRDSLWKQGVESQLDNMDGKLDQIYQCIRRPECK